MYVGIDVGTSSVKVGCFDPAGNELASNKIEYDLYSKSPGYKELDPDLVFLSTMRCLKEIFMQVKNVKSISVSALGEAVVFLDKDNHPLSNIIVGTDIRGQEELQELTNKVGGEKLVDISRVNLSSIYTVNKILWIRNHYPALYKKARRICTVQDYIIGKLCGNYVIDYAMASRTLLFDSINKNWSPFLLSATEIDEKLLSTPVLAGTKAGTLRPKIAKELDCRPGIAVLAGSHDHVCNALGAGVIKKGWCSNGCGTTEGLTAIVSMTKDLGVISGQQISFEPFVLDGVYNTVAWNNTSGAMYRWFINHFVDNSSPYAYLETQIPETPSNLMVLPHFSGAATPNMDARSKGAILGLTLQTKPYEIFQALIEAANFELYSILHALSGSAINVTNIVSTGSALSETVLRIKTNILGVPIRTVKCKQTGALGGAILGAVSNGDYHTYGEAVKEMVHYGDTYYPDGRIHKMYAERYGLYACLYSNLSSINHRLYDLEHQI